eukprot:TRINITY_DN5958_c0_g2_i1.p1 TRINITY_DN5958_c0_g2~~TRINITY_DN5958_c0_g2_i1.p1  ORF type:complete len:1534 (-),score=351.48 TRINITY_DN5958_c0_g2_i1:371-4432(-)
MAHLPYHIVAEMLRRLKSLEPPTEFEKLRHLGVLSGDVVNSSLCASDKRERVFWLKRPVPDGSQGGGGGGDGREGQSALKPSATRHVGVFGADGLLLPEVGEKQALDADVALHASVMGIGGSPRPVASKSMFDFNLSVFSGGVLRGALGDGACLGGSSVVACLLQNDTMTTSEELERYRVINLLLYRKLRCAPLLTSRDVFGESIAGRIRAFTFGVKGSFLHRAQQRYEDRNRPYCEADLDIFFVGKSREALAGRMAKTASRICKNIEEMYGPAAVVQTPNAITIAGPWPSRHVQLVKYAYEHVDEVLAFQDLDCTAVIFDGREVVAAPRAVRAFATGFNFVPMRMLTRRRGTVQRVAKYRCRGYGLVCFDLCKHQPRCDVEVDSGTAQALDEVVAVSQVTEHGSHSKGDEFQRALHQCMRPISATHSVENWARKGIAVAVELKRRMRRQGVKSLLPRGIGIDKGVIDDYVRILPYLTALGLLESPLVWPVVQPLTKESMLPLVDWLRSKDFAWADWSMVPRNPSAPSDAKRICACGAIACGPAPGASEEAAAPPQLTSSLEENLKELTEATKITDAEDAALRRCILEVKRTVCKACESRKVTPRITPFGSCVNGFGNKGADVDIVVEVKEEEMAPVRAAKAAGKGAGRGVASGARGVVDVSAAFRGSQGLSVSGRGRSGSRGAKRQRAGGRGLAAELDVDETERSAILMLREEFANTPGFTVEAVRLAARVPLLKLRFEGDIEVDVSVNNTVPLAETRWLQAWADIEPKVAELGKLVKLWGKRHSLCGAAAGHLSSFAYYLLAIYYCQACHGAPNLQRGGSHQFEDSSLTKALVEREKHGGWHLKDSLLDLVKGFFKFYSCDFWWGEEVAAVRLWQGKRLRSDDSLVKDSGLPFRTRRRLHIEDAFNIKNLHDTLWPNNEQRLRDALQHSHLALQEGRFDEVFCPSPSTQDIFLCSGCQDRQALLVSRQPDMSQKVALVTGGSSVVGMDVVCALLRLGAKVIVPSRFALRTEQRIGRRVEAEMLERLDVVACDLRHIESIKALSADIRAKHEKLHLIIDCASQAPWRQQLFSSFRGELAALEATPSHAEKGAEAIDAAGEAFEEPEAKEGKEKSRGSTLQKQAEASRGQRRAASALRRETEKQAQVPSAIPALVSCMQMTTTQTGEIPTLVSLVESALDAADAVVEQAPDEALDVSKSEAKSTPLVIEHMGTLMVNVVAPYLLTRLLLPALGKAAQESGPSWGAFVIKAHGAGGAGRGSRGSIERKLREDRDTLPLCKLLVDRLGGKLGERHIHTSVVDISGRFVEARLSNPGEDASTQLLQPALEGFEQGTANATMPSNGSLLRSFREVSW